MIFTVSGTTYDNAVVGLPLPAPVERKKGFGRQYDYDLDANDQWLLIDALAEAGCVTAEPGHPQGVNDAIYKDLGRALDQIGR